MKKLTKIDVVDMIIKEKLARLEAKAKEAYRIKDEHIHKCFEDNDVAIAKYYGDRLGKSEHGRGWHLVKLSSTLEIRITPELTEAQREENFRLRDIHFNLRSEIREIEDNMRQERAKVMKELAGDKATELLEALTNLVLSKEQPCAT
jgi:hypothetical protein